MQWMVKTPKGIMYYGREEAGLVYCYDEQTGRDEVFTLAEVSYYNPLYPLHEFSFPKEKKVP